MNVSALRWTQFDVDEKCARMNYKMRVLAQKGQLKLSMWQCCFCGEIIDGAVRSCVVCKTSQNLCFGGLLIPGQDEDSLTQLVNHYKQQKVDKENRKRTRRSDNMIAAAKVAGEQGNAWKCTMCKKKGVEVIMLLSQDLCFQCKMHRPTELDARVAKFR